MAGGEWNWFEEVGIRINQFLRKIISSVAVKVSAKSFRVVHIFRMNADGNRKKTLKTGEYSARCLCDYRSPQRHSYLQM